MKGRKNSLVKNFILRNIGGNEIGADDLDAER